MSHNDFYTPKELGIEQDDTAFLSRFEQNLNLEPRPALVKPSRSLFYLMVFVGAAIFTLAMWLEMPFWFPYVLDAETFVFTQANRIGLSVSSILIGISMLVTLLSLGLFEIGYDFLLGLARDL